MWRAGLAEDPPRRRSPPRSNDPNEDAPEIQGDQVFLFEFLAAANGPRDFTTQGATYHAGILRSMPPATKDRCHSTQKPVAVLRDLVKVAKPGETILDPFVGSGTTALACLETGRRFVGIELTDQYFDIALERIKTELRGSPSPTAAPSLTE